ncbi:DUF2029 domain-containing protein [Nocardioides albidus]|uniref:DUF2029 domain-containing protein n=1 Tax=Nocardioides albidus TaxID=1517589 RepID=A0A5C4W3X4_9ACTN|nr:septum formation family protein [Nocardioides albidus]TNM42763.1 DUF2029 domain-containing protein [Nocardioides albidus]
MPSYTSVAGVRPPPTRAPETDKGLGWTGVGMALTVCVPLLPLAGAVIAIVTLARRRFRPRWAAVAALIVGVGATILQVAAVPSVVDGLREGVNDSIEEDTERARDSGEPREVSVLKLQTGDCFDSAVLRGLSGAEEVETQTVTLLPCERKHDLEVYRIFEMSGDDFPGQAAIDRQAQRCIKAFERFVGKPYGTSRFEVYYTYPKERSWQLLGDRNVTCLAGHPRKKVAGTLEGRRR